MLCLSFPVACDWWFWGFFTVGSLNPGVRRAWELSLLASQLHLSEFLFNFHNTQQCKLTRWAGFFLAPAAAGSSASLLFYSCSFHICCRAVPNSPWRPHTPDPNLHTWQTPEISSTGKMITFSAFSRIPRGPIHFSSLLLSLPKFRFLFSPLYFPCSALCQPPHSPQNYLSKTQILSCQILEWPHFVP